MPDHSGCEAARGALRALLLEGREPEARILDHWRQCQDCRALGEQVLRDIPVLDPLPLPVPQAQILQEVRRQARNALVGRGFIALGLTLGLLGLWALLSWESFRRISPLDAMLLFLLFALPLLLVYGLAQWPRRQKLYKRLRKGRILSGVCLGLAERTQTPAWLWRAGLLLLFFLHPGVSGIYALMAVAMPIHPEDRAGLFRFKVARLYHRWVG